MDEIIHKIRHNKYLKNNSKVYKYLIKSLCLFLGIMVLYLPHHHYEWSASRDGALTDVDDYYEIINMGIIGLSIAGVFSLFAGNNRLVDIIIVSILIILMIYVFMVAPMPFFGT